MVLSFMIDRADAFNRAAAQGIGPPGVAALAREILSRLRSRPSWRTADARALRREFSKRIAAWPARDVIALASRLVEVPLPLGRFVGSELLARHPNARSGLDAKSIERLGRGIDSWGAVDVFACYVAGPAWRDGRIPDARIHSWARSPDRWWRRAALVSTVPLNVKSQGGSGDTSRTLSLCARLLGDRDDMVVKAMSWALRELAKRDPAAVRRFLTKHEAALAARVLREVRNKLRTGRKNPGRE